MVYTGTYIDENGVGHEISLTEEDSIEALKNDRDALLRRYLCGMGAYEAVTYSFISPKWYDALRLPENDPLRLSAKLMNPLGEDYSVMRTTLIPSMLNTLSTNINRGNAGAAFYELGKQFLPKSLPLTEQPEERPALCIGLYGENATFYTLKGMVEALLTRFGVKNVTWSRSTAPYLHPGRAAQFFAGEKLLGVLGEVHPAVAENFKFKTRAYVAEMNLNVLDESATNVGDVKDMPRFPAVQRDFAFVMKEEMPVGDVMNEMKTVAGELCEEVHLFDIYRGAGIAPGKKSVAFSLTLRADDRTLTDLAARGGPHAGRGRNYRHQREDHCQCFGKIRCAVAFLMQTGYNKGNEKR